LKLQTADRICGATHGRRMLHFVGIVTGQPLTLSLRDFFKSSLGFLQFEFADREKVCSLSISLEALELRRWRGSFTIHFAGVAELADALDSKSSDRKIVWVRAPPPALVCVGIVYLR